MIFLIEYDRPSGKIVVFRSFSDDERSIAEELRLDMELDLHRKNVAHEVVLLEAEDEHALRRTHRRYFENLHELAEASRATQR